MPYLLCSEIGVCERLAIRAKKVELHPVPLAKWSLRLGLEAISFVLCKYSTCKSSYDTTLRRSDKT